MERIFDREVPLRARHAACVCAGVRTLQLRHDLR